MTDRYNYYPVAARVVTLIFGFIAAVILLHIGFVLLEANPGNALVAIIADLAAWFGFLFKDMFTLENDKLQTLLNYGIAALIYLLIGAAIRGLFRRYT
jgi:hypothetical protein